MLTLQDAWFYTTTVLQESIKKCGFSRSEWGIFVSKDTTQKMQSNQ